MDKQYGITLEEKEKVLASYFKDGFDQPIQTFPSKEKRKIILLQQIMTRFEKGINYTEKQVNELLKPIYVDYVSIRRYLIEYGFMDRTSDCTLYWVK